MTVTRVVWVVTGRMECVLSWDISEGGDTMVEHCLAVLEHYAATHVWEIQVQGSVFTEANGHGAWVSATDTVTLVLCPVT